MGKINQKRYSYDAANSQVGIVSMKADGKTEKLRQTNRYDGEGLRYETEENGKIIRFLFDRGRIGTGKQKKSATQGNTSRFL